MGSSTVLARRDKETESEQLDFFLINQSLIKANNKSIIKLLTVEWWVALHRNPRLDGTGSISGTRNTVRWRKHQSVIFV